MTGSARLARSARWIATALALAFVLAFCLLLDAVRPGPPTTRSWEVAALDTHAPGPAGQPVTAGTLPPWKDVAWIDLTFEARADTDAYPNFFQTADGPGALRMELVHPDQLYLALSDRHYLLVTDRVQASAWHRYRLRWVKEDSVEVAIDDRTVARWTGAPAAQELALQTLVVGTGFSHLRDFAGQLRGFRLTAHYRAQRPPLQRFFLDAGGALALALLLAGALAAHRPRTGLPMDHPRPAPAAHPWTWAGIALLCGAAGWWMYGRSWPPGKWLMLLCFAPLFALPLLPLRRFAVAIAWESAGWLAVLAFAFLQLRNDAATGWLGAACSLAAALACWRFAPAGTPRWRPALTVGTVFAAAWACLATTPSSLALAAQAQRHPATALALLAGLAVPFAWKHLQAGDPLRDPAPAAAHLAVRAWPYLLFALLALRNDALAAGGAEMHWEYFVGPIRSVHAGAWLLWDAPSQYGFLNVLLAALLPVRSEWQALYLLQAAVLFACACLALATLRIVLPAPRWLLALLAAAAVFYADPALIGPAAYPSSTGTRFLWIYVMLYLAADVFLRRGLDAAAFLQRGGWAWVAGVFWSGESAVYTSVIYLTAVLAPLGAALVRNDARGDAARAVRAFARAVVVLAVALAVVALFYRVRLGHGPDLRMHFLYSTAYARGFGELPVPWNGPLWLLALPLALGTAIAASAWRSTAPRALAALCTMAALVAMGTYYVGRAVPNNITALTPLLLMALALLHGASGRQGTASAWSAALVATLALQGVGGWVAGEIAAGGRLPRWRVEPVEARLREPGTELQDLLREAGVSADSAVAYYGFATTMPRGTAPDYAHPRTWLPVPVQLLEDPIPAAVQERILARFMQRRRTAGFIVQARGEFEDRFERWRALLARTHEEARTWESAHYRILRYEPRRSP